MPAPFAMPRSCYAAQRSCAACGAGPLCVPVGGGPPARSPHASLRLGVVDLEARPGPAATHRHRGQALPPPTGTAARPSCALHTSGAWSLMCGSARRLEARSGPATHRHRGQAPPPTGTAVRPRRPRVPQPGPLAPSAPAVQRNSRLSLLLAAPLVFRAPSGPAAREIATREPEGSEVSISKPARALRTLRRPPHQWRLVADVWFGASARCPARLRHGPRASQISRVKPVSPLLAQA